MRSTLAAAVTHHCMSVWNGRYPNPYHFYEVERFQEERKESLIQSCYALMQQGFNTHEMVNLICPKPH